MFKRFHLWSFDLEKGIEKMGTLVCQTCNSTIDHFEDEKVTVLYSKCNCCEDHHIDDEV